MLIGVARSLKLRARHLIKKQQRKPRTKSPEGLGGTPRAGDHPHPPTMRGKDLLEKALVPRAVLDVIRGWLLLERRQLGIACPTTRSGRPCVLCMRREIARVAVAVARASCCDTDLTYERRNLDVGLYYLGGGQPAQ